MTIYRLKELAASLDVEDISSVVLDNPKFAIWSGSPAEGMHHYGDGGLLQHTTEVVELAMRTNDYFISCGKGVAKQPLFLAALFHDIGKLWDYEKINGVWGAVEHKEKIYHICRSALVWHDAVKGIRGYEGIEDEVLHAILAHHGRLEWKSPVVPKTRTAWILHLSDNLSAKITHCYTFKPNNNYAN